MSEQTPAQQAETQAERIEALAMLYENDASILKGQRAAQAKQIAEDLLAGDTALRAAVAPPAQEIERLTSQIGELRAEVARWKDSSDDANNNWQEDRTRAEAAEAELERVRAAMTADDERLRNAAERVGVVYVGCDTADALVDRIEELRAAVAGEGKEISPSSPAPSSDRETA